MGVVRPRIVYGLSTSRTDGLALDEVLDALDDVCPGGWDAVSWRRPSATRLVVASPVEARCVVEEAYLKVRVLPLGMLVADMGNNQNEWLRPSLPGSGESLAAARALVDGWTAEMWPAHTEQPEPEPAVAGPPRLAVVRRTPQAEVLEAFGIESASVTAEDGSQVGLFVFGQQD